VLRLTNYKMPDLVELVHPRRGLSVRNAEPLIKLIERRLYAEKGVNNGGGGGADAGGLLRSQFKTTVLFAPEVVTDDAGRAHVEFVLPDNLTTYRIMAVAVTEAIERVADIRPECKWPNDLLLQGRKFCGILLESASSTARPAYAVVGIGVNVNQMLFPPDISAQATSIARETGAQVDRVRLLCAVLESLEHWYGPATQDDFSAVLDKWRSLAPMFGHEVTVTTGQDSFSGTAIGLADDGGLMVEYHGKRQVVYAGDVTLSHTVG